MKRGLAIAISILCAGLCVRDAQARCLARPDTEVSGIKLADSASVKAIVGTKYEFYGHEGTRFDPAHFMSRDGKQMFSMLHYPGDAAHSHREFDVHYAGSSHVEQTIPVDAFTTRNGIKLGLTKAAVTQRFGSCFKVTKNEAGEETIRYEEKDKKSALLKRYRMPLYFAEYQFKEGRLTGFNFGFEYP